MPGPSPDDPHPIKGFPQVGFLKPLVKNPNIVVGEHSYYDDPDGPERFEARCVLYHFPFIGDKLVIGNPVVGVAGGQDHAKPARHRWGGYGCAEECRVTEATK